MQVSVIIPVRNEEQLIAQTLTILLQQTILPAQVIIVNNNSTDHTVEVVNELQQQYTDAEVTLTIIDCPVGTQASARERGVASATSELIAFIDADTVLPPQWIERGIHVFEQNTSLVGTGGPMMYQQWLMTAANFFLYCFVNIVRSRYFFYGCNGLFRASAYKQCHGLEGCDAFMTAHHHQEPYDDVWLSQRLQHVGDTYGHLSLYARGQIRVAFDHSSIKRASVRQANLKQSFQRWLRQRRETRTVLQHLHSEPTRV